MYLSTRGKIFLHAAALAFAGAAVFYLLYPLPKPMFPSGESTVVFDARGEVLRVFLNGNEEWHLTAMDSLIPERLSKSVLLYEDRFFRIHPGINPVAVLRASIQNMKSRRVVSGASTLTMQVARLMRPKRRSYWNKLQEMALALKLEYRFSKYEILWMYLNQAPYGGNIVGYQTASLRYFKKRPASLTWGEAATLAVLPNAPALKPGADPETLVGKRNRLLTRLYKNGGINEETYRLSLLEPVPDKSFPFEMIAPHLTQFLETRKTGNAIRTSIQKSFQQEIESRIERRLALLSSIGIRNAAALVMETRTGKVRAYIGSQDFFDRAEGQVDGVLAPRSTGSILKPFLYALCMDEGLLLPETKIRDVPTSFGSFTPANYDERFEGLVAARDALIRSLNVPAVRCLADYGLGAFYSFLEKAGVSTLWRQPDDYGLPLILGGSEMSLWELAGLYRGLANGGVFAPGSFLENRKGTEKKSGIRLMSEGASFLVLECLKELGRPGAEYYWEQYQNQWPLAWKTGTSYGNRDGWALGVSPEWTLGVWVGNFDGTGTPNLSGAKCAGPILFDIFNFLPKDPSSAWFEKPEAGLEPVKICRETGYLAGPDCGNTLTTEAPRYMKPLCICPYHQKIYTDQDGRYRVCSLCWEAGSVMTTSVLAYPPDIVQCMKQEGLRYPSIPPHYPGCSALRQDPVLKILYPAMHAHLYIPRDFDGNFQKVTLKAGHSGGEPLFWYLDDALLGTSEGDHVKAVALTRGWHHLEIMDGAGNCEGVDFYADMKEWGESM